MMSVRLTSSPATATTLPSRLFASRISTQPHQPQYAVAAKGQRFLALEPTEPERNTLTFLINWLNTKPANDSGPDR